MKTLLGLLVLVGLSYGSTSSAWENNTEYIYQVNGRTLTSLHDLSDHYAGVFLKAKLYISLRSDGNLQAKVTDAQYAQIHTLLANSWNTEIPESQLIYKPLGLSDKTFLIVLEKGIIKSLIVEKNITSWESNVIKGIVSQFQLDIEGKKAILSPYNILPNKNKLAGVFKTMEETITGKTETSYEIHRLPQYLIQSKPWLMPKPELVEEGEIVELIKTKNYTNSEERPIYHYGFRDLSKGTPSSNKMGSFFIRQSNSHVILTGKLSKYTIQQAQTVNKVIVNPTLNSKEEGSVVSTLNVTLNEIRTQNTQSQELVNPIEIGNLVYSFEAPFTIANEVHQKQEGQAFMEESISDENSNELEMQLDRFRRSLQNDLHKPHSYPSPREMQFQTRPTIGQAPEFPLLPYYMGFKGKSIKTNNAFNLKKTVEKIAREISEDIPDPEQILIQSTLSKYTMLCSLLRLMNEEEINSIAQELYTSSERGPQRLTWATFRDAVAEAGTGPAFLNIQKWIESQKIVDEEASEVVATMSYAVRVPTEEFMLRFFDLIRNPKVINQEYLNETALLSFTRLVNSVYLNKDESHNQYPIDVFRSFYTKDGKEFVKSILLPYITEHLHEAVLKADTRKIHIYIRALGNVGHRKILEAFEPYLEGQKQASQFQRMLMVLSLDKLVILEPVVARAVLYRIYRNTAEVPEVRVVAVYQLMRTVPPAEMIQRMAESTNTEAHEQVNAAVKTAIEYASQLTSPGSQKLRSSAEAAKHVLTKKVYGKQQSLNFLQDFVVEKMNIEFKHNLLQVGSVDHTLPKGVKYTGRGNYNGMKHYFFNIQTMVSSIKELTNVVYQQTEKYHNMSKHSSGNHQWSSATIAESLNLQTNEREQLEGFIYSEMDSLQKFWSFDNKTIEQLPHVIRQKEQILRKGKSFSYMKLKQLKEMTVACPTEMGFPFVYSYDMPLLMHYEATIKAIADPEISKNNKLHIPKHLFGEIVANVTVSTKVQSHLSVVTPFDHQIYMSGFDRNIQAHFPLNAKINIGLNEKQTHAKIEFEGKNNQKASRLLHYSSWPYTSRSDVMDPKPVALRTNTSRIRSKQNTHRSFDFVVGKKETGMSYRVWGHHPKQSVNIIQLASLLKSEGIATIWHQVWDKYSLQQTEASIAFIPNQSTTRKGILNLRYQQEYQRKYENRSKRGFWNNWFGFEKQSQQEQKQSVNKSEETFWSMDQLSSKVERDPKKRQETIISYISAGIKNSHTYYLDTSVEFKGDKTYEHTFTMAGAKSNVAPESSFVSFYEINAERPLKFAMQVKGYVPNTNELDLSYSLRNNPKSKYDVLLQYGHSEQQSSKVRATIDLNRSTARRQYLEKNPLYQVCMRQMQDGNLHLSSCQKMMTESNVLDNIKIQLRYENFRKQCTNSIDSIFKAVRFLYYPMSDIKTVQLKDQDKINLTIQFQPEHLRQVNVAVKVHDEETEIYNISVPEIARAVFASHPVLHLKDRVLEQLIVPKNMKPACVLDYNFAQTFSNRIYPISIQNGWTVMMMYIPQEALPRGETSHQPVQQLKKQVENFAVLVREVSSEKREVKITFNHPEEYGKTVEVTMNPNKQRSIPFSSVFVDGKQVKFDDKEAAGLFNGYIEIYALSNREVKMEIQNWFYIIFDGNHVKLTATSEKLLDSTIGLCGRFSEDQYEDFWTPNNCIVRSAEKFVKSFLIEGKRLQQHQQQNQECIPKVLPLYTDVISDRDVKRNKSTNIPGINLRTRYIENNGQICFTIYPVPVCKNISLNSITKDVPVYCINESETSDDLKDQINRGHNPDLSQKSPIKTVKLQLPQKCA